MTCPPPLTRADLLDHPAFAALALGADTSGNPRVWTNLYACPPCGTAWENAWSCQCDDECPDCGDAHAPATSRWIGPEAPELRALWETLPEAGSEAGDAVIRSSTA